MRMLLLVLSTLCVLACGCSPSSPKEPTAYPVRGKVVGVEEGGSRLVVSHQEIAGFMKAMTMPFRVGDTASVRSVAVGDSIRGILMVKGTARWLDSVQVIWRASH